MLTSAKAVAVHIWVGKLAGSDDNRSLRSQGDGERMVKT